MKKASRRSKLVVVKHFPPFFFTSSLQCPTLIKNFSPSFSFATAQGSPVPSPRHRSVSWRSVRDSAQLPRYSPIAPSPTARPHQNCTTSLGLLTSACLPALFIPRQQVSLHTNHHPRRLLRTILSMTHISLPVPSKVVHRVETRTQISTSSTRHKKFPLKRARHFSIQKRTTFKFEHRVCSHDG